jgi:hypothetical protein
MMWMHPVKLRYLLDTLRKTDFRNAIVSAVKESKVFLGASIQLSGDHP